MRKLFLTTLILVGLSVSASVFAASRLSVPENDPLQPIPPGAGPNISNNINTPESEINQNLGEQNQQPEVPEQPTPDEEGFENLDQPGSPIVGEVPTSSSTTYWVLLFLGLAGLIGIGIWGYVRFVRGN